MLKPCSILLLFCFSLAASDADSISNALRMATEMDEHHLNAQIVEQLSAQSTTA